MKAAPAVFEAQWTAIFSPFGLTLVTHLEGFCGIIKAFK
jgi:hypothetical protein